MVLLSTALLSGCLPLSKQPAKLAPPEAAELPPTNLQMETAWNNKVLFAPDVVSGGKEMPGLGLRVYLFGPEIGVPMLREGSLLVKLFDVTGKQDGVPRLLEVWEIDPVALRRLAKSDIIGPGYTLFLPWGTYSPTVQRVNMQVTFSPVGTQPIMKQSGTISIDHAFAWEREKQGVLYTLPVPPAASPPVIAEPK